jgi:hypothetical protein
MRAASVCHGPFPFLSFFIYFNVKEAHSSRGKSLGVFSFCLVAKLPNHRTYVRADYRRKDANMEYHFVLKGIPIAEHSHS